MTRPIIGITIDNADSGQGRGKYEVGTRYSDELARFGAVPLLLPHEVALADTYVAMCDGIVLTGGTDPRTEQFGEPTHPRARPLDERRQAFELAILAAIDRLRDAADDAATRRDTPALGVCLGMQMMALHHGGRLNQYMPENTPTAADHKTDVPHGIIIKEPDSVLGQPNGTPPPHDAANLAVHSHHQQAVADAGHLRIVATAADGVIEAIDDPKRSFYLGVQWHPERGGEGFFNRGLLERFARACAAAK